MNRKFENIYISDNIQALDTVALDQVKNMKLKGDKLVNAAKKLLNEFNESQNDQEKAYIVGKRYLHFVDQMFRTCEDKKYMEIRYGTEYNKVNSQVEELKATLEKRYHDINHRLVQKTQIPQPNVEVIPINKFQISGSFVTCKELYEALVNKELNMLLIDVRPAEEYQTSKINCKCCINIPDNVICAGLSANTLGFKLAEDIQKYWDKRDSYDILVLMDWNSNSENVCSSKLEMLRSCIVEWDFNRNYKQDPVFLSGGFKEFLDTYPAEVNNAHTYLVHKNDELDELLEIENVIYPTDGTFGSSPDERKDNLNESKEVTELINESMKDESKIEEVPEIPASDEPMSESPRSPSPKDVPQLPPDDIQIKNAMEANRLRMLNEARSKKPTVNTIGKSGDSSVKSIINVPPTINRSIKPTYYLEKITGRTGIRNIRNTCYMNTALQCFRVLPVIKHLFLTGKYKKFITTKKPSLITELAIVIEDLWNQDDTFITPMDFYNKICALDKLYKRGNHEDCMEFFLFLFSKIHEDCMHDIARPDVLTPRMEAKICQLLGKSSIFVDLFFHQVRSQRHCAICRTNSYSFELDNTLMLPIPDYTCNMNELISDYFKEYSIPDYCCTKCKKPVRNKREVVDSPLVLVCVLKRYSQLYNYGTQVLVKNETVIDFDEHVRFGKSKYKLYSLAMHQGTLKAGHYIAAGLINNEWYEFNDEVVKRTCINTDSVRTRVCSLFYIRED